MKFMIDGLVTVIIPCYNGAEHLRVSLNSILEQTYKKIQIIFVDDGSTDDTKDIALAYEQRFVQQKMQYMYIYQENQGVGAAVSNGIQYIEGEVLTLLDADDYFMKESIEKKVEFLKKNKEFGIVRTNGYLCLSDDENLDETKLFVNDTQEIKEEFIYENLILGKTNNWAGSYLIRTKYLKELYQNQKFYSSRYGQNMQLLVPVAKKYKSGFINEPLMKYIQWDQTITRDKDASYDKQRRMYEGFKDIRLQLLKQFDDNNKILKEKVIEMYDHIFLRLAYEYGKKEDVFKLYNKLKNKKKVISEEKTYYYYTKGRIYKIIALVCSKFHIW